MTPPTNLQTAYRLLDSALNNSQGDNPRTAFYAVMLAAAAIHALLGIGEAIQDLRSTFENRP